MWAELIERISQFSSILWWIILILVVIYVAAISACILDMSGEETPFKKEIRRDRAA
jgi:hypothetical protein